MRRVSCARSNCKAASAERPETAATTPPLESRHASIARVSPHTRSAQREPERDDACSLKPRFRAREAALADAASRASAARAAPIA